MYVIDSLDDACFYALMAPPKGRGWVYEVALLGEREPDPDYLGDGEAIAAQSARVLRVVERNVVQWHGFSMPEAAALLTPDGDQRPHAVRIHDLGATG